MPALPSAGVLVVAFAVFAFILPASEGAKKKRVIIKVPAKVRHVYHEHTKPIHVHKPIIKPAHPYPVHFDDFPKLKGRWKNEDDFGSWESGGGKHRGLFKDDGWEDDYSWEEDYDWDLKRPLKGRGRGKGVRGSKPKRNLGWSSARKKKNAGNTAVRGSGGGGRGKWKEQQQYGASGWRGDWKGGNKKGRGGEWNGALHSDVGDEGWEDEVLDEKDQGWPHNSRPLKTSWKEEVHGNNGWKSGSKNKHNLWNGGSESESGEWNDSPLGNTAGSWKTGGLRGDRWQENGRGTSWEGADWKGAGKKNKGNLSGAGRGKEKEIPQYQDDWDEKPFSGDVWKGTKSFGGKGGKWLQGNKRDLSGYEDIWQEKPYNGYLRPEEKGSSRWADEGDFFQAKEASSFYPQVTGQDNWRSNGQLVTQGRAFTPLLDNYGQASVQSSLQVRDGSQFKPSIPIIAPGLGQDFGSFNRQLQNLGVQSVNHNNNDQQISIEPQEIVHLNREGNPQEKEESDNQNIVLPHRGQPFTPSSYKRPPDQLDLIGQNILRLVPKQTFNSEHQEQGGKKHAAQNWDPSFHHDGKSVWNLNSFGADKGASSYSVQVLQFGDQTKRHVINTIHKGK